jgi:hypothetical protein
MVLLHATTMSPKTPAGTFKAEIARVQFPPCELTGADGT